MALWLVRTGSHGQYERRFLKDQRIYLTWEGLNCDLAALKTQKEFLEIQQQYYPDGTLGAAANYAGMIRKFVVDMQPGDWVVIPRKHTPAINIAEITGPYTYDPKAEDPYYHSRSIKWIAKDVPRSVFDQDLLYSFGAFSTICQIKRNDAEQRVKDMAQTGWKTTLEKVVSVVGNGGGGEEAGVVDLERLARDLIAKLIIRKFKGHGLERLVGAILKAQGYTVYQSPEGADKGIDLLAAQGPLGFGRPRICVQVKSSNLPVDSPTLNQLIGSMQNVQADQGLLVSWGGFKSSVDKEIPTHFFHVRLWDQDTLIEELLAQYNNLDADIRAELPFKQIWAVSLPEEDD